MTNKLGPMIISNPGRRGWGYRCRDAALVGFTVGLWCLFGFHTYLTVTSAEFLTNQAHYLVILKIVAIDFVAVFIALHAWVIYERLLFRKRVKGKRVKAWSSEALPDGGHAAPAQTRSSRRAAEHSL